MINLTSHTLTLHHETYGLKIIPRGSLEAEAIEELLGKHGETEELWKKLSEMEQKGPVNFLIEKYIPADIRDQFREEGGHVSYAGIQVPPTFFRRAIRAGNVKRMIRFIQRLQENPYEDNHWRAFDFLESSNLPLSDDGCILAYKSVRKTFYDWHSNSIRYYPGDEPQLKETQVDTHTHSLCSAGLHFCSYGYMENSYFGGERSRIVLMKVAPEDIASIPMPSNAMAVDSYRNSKGRAFKVKSICALSLESHDDFTTLNERLIHADDDELESIINEYIDESIPAAEELAREPSGSRRTVDTNSMTPDALLEGAHYTAKIVKVDKNIYREWLAVKGSVVSQVAKVLEINDNEIIVDEEFTSEEAPYERAMTFSFDDESGILTFNESPAG